MNITDVGHLVSDADSGEDKMEVDSRQSGHDGQMADYYTEAFQKGDLNIEDRTSGVARRTHP